MRVQLDTHCFYHPSCTIQTSTLILPRKSCSRERILHPLPATPSEKSSPAVDVLQIDQEKEACIVDRAAGHQQTPSNAVRTPSEAIRVGQMHVRVGLEGFQDADQGQAPTIWAVSTGQHGRRECTHSSTFRTQLRAGLYFWFSLLIVRKSCVFLCL